MDKGRLTLATAAAAIALSGCGSSTPKGYVKAPATSCAMAYAVKHHIGLRFARRSVADGYARCRLVWQTS